RNYDTNFVQEIVNLLKDKKKAQVLRKQGRDRALTKYSWESIFTQWESLIKQLQESDGIMVTCPECKQKQLNSFELSKHKVKFHGDTVEIADIEIKEYIP